VSIMKPEHTKYITNVIPDIKRRRTHMDFVETLDRILEKNRLDIFNRKTFDKNASQQINNKNLPSVLGFGGIYTLGLTTLLSFTFLTQPWPLIVTGLGTIAGIAMFIMSKAIKNRPTTDQFSKLMEGAKNPEVARIILDWMKSVIAKNYAFYQTKGKKTELIPREYYTAPNISLAFLGDDKHRQAIGLPRKISDAPFLLDRKDLLKIFYPLVEKLSKTEAYAHLNQSSQNKKNVQSEKQKNHKPKKTNTPIIKPSSTKASDIPPVKVPEQLNRASIENKLKAKSVSQRVNLKSSKAPKNKLEAIEARIESAKKRGTYFVKKTPKARDYRHLQLILDQYDMLELIIEYSETEDYSLFVANKIRNIWMKALRYIYENWDTWIQYCSNPNSAHSFSKKLFGPELLDFKDSQKKIAFREGKHREMSDLIIDCFEIPTSMIIKNDQLPLFEIK